MVAFVSMVEIVPTAVVAEIGKSKFEIEQLEADL
jgi:hypothetical protein